ncbi:hypothetical protein ACWD25_06730 [Streptomyces sp. NPDC002920]
MSGDDSEARWMWVAIVLIGGVTIAIVAAGVFWLATQGRPTGERITGTLAAAGITFFSVATLGITIGSFLIA